MEILLNLVVAVVLVVGLFWLNYRHRHRHDRRLPVLVRLRCDHPGCSEDAAHRVVYNRGNRSSRWVWVWRPDGAFCDEHVGEAYWRTATA